MKAISANSLKFSVRDAQSLLDDTFIAHNKMLQIQ